MRRGQCLGGGGRERGRRWWAVRKLGRQVGDAVLRARKPGRREVMGGNGFARIQGVAELQRFFENRTISRSVGNTLLTISSMDHGNWSRGSTHRPTCSRKEGRRRHSPWRRELFLRWCTGSGWLTEDWKEADCRLTLGALMQCPVRRVVLLMEKTGG